MPLYEYEDAATGERVELFRPIARRDCVPEGLRRVVSLTGRGPFTGRARDPQCADVAVPRAFKELEQTMPRAQIERESGFNTRQIKQAWDFNNSNT